MVKKARTNSEGKIIFTDLYFGKYYVKELETYDEYIVNLEEYED